VIDHDELTDHQELRSMLLTQSLPASAVGARPGGGDPYDFGVPPRQTGKDGILEALMNLLMQLCLHDEGEKGCTRTRLGVLTILDGQ
jgi:hypothetical protein